MEESPAKPSVLKLAGMFKGHPFPEPGGHEGKATAAASPHPPKPKHRNSALIEKLQANLALPATVLPPTTRSPEVKLQQRPASASPPRTPPSVPICPPAQELSKEEVPVSFEKPAEGAVLRNFNKGRARVSVKRRPPTRQHRKSCTEEQWEEENEAHPLLKDSPRASRSQQRALETPAEASADKPSQTAVLDGPSPTPETRTGGDSPAEDTETQEESQACATESTTKDKGDGTNVPKHQHSTGEQEPQSKARLSGATENKKSQAGRPAD